MQVEGFTNVFACGDVMRSPFPKTAYTADLSAGIVAQNIVRLHKDQELLQFPKVGMHMNACLYLVSRSNDALV